MLLQLSVLIMCLILENIMCRKAKSLIGIVIVVKILWLPKCLEKNITW